MVPLSSAKSIMAFNDFLLQKLFPYRLLFLNKQDNYLTQMHTLIQ